MFPAALQKRNNHCIAVIGDGAITGGMAYEAMNHAGFMDTNMIVILNDNQQASVAAAYPCLRDQPAVTIPYAPREVKTQT